jgi:hypothetical protein
MGVALLMMVALLYTYTRSSEIVGDDDEADVEGGRAAGFVPVRIEDDEGTPEFWATLRAMV